MVKTTEDIDKFAGWIAKSARLSGEKRAGKRMVVVNASSTPKYRDDKRVTYEFKAEFNDTVKRSRRGSRFYNLSWNVASLIYDYGVEHNDREEDPNVYVTERLKSIRNAVVSDGKSPGLAAEVEDSALRVCSQ